MPLGPRTPAAAGPRYSTLPLPAERFLPGRSPRPRGPVLPEGLLPGSWEPSEWRRLIPYLYAVDLHNHGFWWEAHEVWEGLWHAAGRTTPTARFVQGLIQVAAAHLNRVLGKPASARRQALRGVTRLAALPSPAMGIDVPSLAARVRTSFGDPSGGAVRIELVP